MERLEALGVPRAVPAVREHLGRLELERDEGPRAPGALLVLDAKGAGGAVEARLDVSDLGDAAVRAEPRPGARGLHRELA